jgi:hypothetical protein
MLHIVRNCTSHNWDTYNNCTLCEYFVSKYNALNGFQLPQIATPESVNDPQGRPCLTLCEDDAIWNLGLADSLLVTERPV